MASFDEFMRDHLRQFFNDVGVSIPALNSANSNDGITAVGRNVRGLFDMKMELVEAENEYKVSAEVAGIPKENLHVSLDKNVLTIEGERKECAEEKKDRYHFTERKYGKIRRAITLPDDVDTEKVQTSYNNGVLCLTFGKAKESKTKKVIKVQ